MYYKEILTYTNQMLKKGEGGHFKTKYSMKWYLLYQIIAVNHIDISTALKLCNKMSKISRYIQKYVAIK